VIFNKIWRMSAEEWEAALDKILAEYRDAAGSLNDSPIGRIVLALAHEKSAKLICEMGFTAGEAEEWLSRKRPLRAKPKAMLVP
jgi:hypothetical protein